MPSQPRTFHPDELALLAAGFPEYQFWSERGRDHLRYVAQGIRLDIRPHTIVTTDLAEMRAALTAGPASSRP